jgi:hypothetical protein
MLAPKPALPLLKPDKEPVTVKGKGWPVYPGGGIVSKGILSQYPTLDTSDT